MNHIANNQHESPQNPPSFGSQKKVAAQKTRNNSSNLLIINIIDVNKEILIIQEEMVVTVRNQYAPKIKVNTEQKVEMIIPCDLQKGDLCVSKKGGNSKSIYVLQH